MMQTPFHSRKKTNSFYAEKNGRYVAPDPVATPGRMQKGVMEFGDLGPYDNCH
jgi:hypothetical protein